MKEQQYAQALWIAVQRVYPDHFSDDRAVLEGWRVGVPAYQEHHFCDREILHAVKSDFPCSVARSCAFFLPLQHSASIAEPLLLPKEWLLSLSFQPDGLPQKQCVQHLIRLA